MASGNDGNSKSYLLGMVCYERGSTKAMSLRKPMSVVGPVMVMSPICTVTFFMGVSLLPFFFHGTRCVLVIRWYASLSERFMCLMRTLRWGRRPGGVPCNEFSPFQC